MATRTIAVINQKGGVGKTTTTVNLGAALARRGRRVLLVDLDPQANLTVHLGFEPGQLTRTTYSLLLGQHGMAEAVCTTSDPNLLVLPATLALANVEIQLASAVGRELILRESLEGWLDPALAQDPLPFQGPAPEAPEPVDFVLIDCPPSLGILTMNALCAATDVLLPIQAEFFALQGVAGILESLKAVQRLNRSLKLSFIVPSLVDFRTNLARDVVEDVRKYFGSLVTRTVIRTNVKLAEAPSYGQTIFEYDPSSRGAEDYAALAAEILGDQPAGEAPAPVAREAAPQATPAPAPVAPPDPGARSQADAAPPPHEGESAANRVDDPPPPTAVPAAVPQPAFQYGVAAGAASVPASGPASGPGPGIRLPRWALEPDLDSPAAEEPAPDPVEEPPPRESGIGFPPGVGGPPRAELRDDPPAERETDRQSTPAERRPGVFDPRP